MAGKTQLAVFVEKALGIKVGAVGADAKTPQLGMALEAVGLLVARGAALQILARRLAVTQ